MNICKICKNSKHNKLYTAYELMYGSKDRFKYFQCFECGCLQISKIPENMAKYYPDNFYSYKKQKRLKDNPVKAFIKKQRTKYLLHHKTVLGRLIYNIYKPPAFIQYLNNLNLNFYSEILDVGSGGGRYLTQLYKEGFKNLTGIDPFIKQDIFYKNGIKIYKKELKNVKKLYDFIILTNSFEHMPDPLNVLKKLYSILKPGSFLLIKIPVADSAAWRKYGIHWVQLDAPRHFFLHTFKSMQILSDKTGFALKNIIHDSSEFQFAGSEQYLRGISLTDNNAYSGNVKGTIFTKKDIKRFKKEAVRLNAAKDGDTVLFYLYKKK